MLRSGKHLTACLVLGVVGLGTFLWLRYADAGSGSLADSRGSQAGSVEGAAGGTAVSSGPQVGSVAHGEDRRTAATAEGREHDHVARVRSRVGRALQAHRAEPTDPLWSDSAESGLREQLASISDGSPAQLVDVDCRSSSCVSTLEWRNYSAAVRDYRRYLMQPYVINCRRSISVPPPEDPSAQYRAHLIMNCDRTNGSEG